MAPLMPMHDSAAAFLTTIWRCTSSCTQMLQPYQSFLPCLHIAHCNHSCDYSTGTAESHVLIAIGIHVRLHCPIHYKLLLCFHSQCGAEYHTASIHCLPHNPIHFIKHTCLRSTLFYVSRNEQTCWLSIETMQPYEHGNLPAHMLHKSKLNLGLRMDDFTHLSRIIFHCNCTHSVFCTVDFHK